MPLNLTVFKDDMITFIGQMSDIFMLFVVSIMSRSPHYGFGHSNPLEIGRLRELRRWKCELGRFRTAFIPRIFVDLIGTNAFI